MQFVCCITYTYALFHLSGTYTAAYSHAAIQQLYILHIYEVLGLQHNVVLNIVTNILEECEK